MYGVHDDDDKASYSTFPLPCFMVFIAAFYRSPSKIDLALTVSHCQALVHGKVS